MFHTWDRLCLVAVAKNILRVLRKLHQCNVLVGDLNPDNILVEPDESVCLVDVDSYQLEDFACPVGSPRFTAPGLLGKNFSTLLRTQDDELFALAVVIFAVLFLGEYPYFGGNEAQYQESVKKGCFVYQFKDGSRDLRPAVGPARCIWSHLSQPLKHAFTRIFANGQRVQTQEFLWLLEGYAKEIETKDSSNAVGPAS